MARPWKLAGILLCLLMMIGCSLTTSSTSSGTAASPYPSPLPGTLPTAQPPQTANGWETVANGLWMKMVKVPDAYAARGSFEMVVVKIDPRQTSIKVHYTPEQFYTLPEWSRFLENYLVIMNGSFFTPEGYAVGLVITDEGAFGYSLQGFGGMLQVLGEQVRVRSLVQEPYQNEYFDHALQGFPMLIQPGGEPARTGEGFDDPSRRSVIGQDTEGYLYLMTTPGSLDQITLRNLQNWLLDNEIEFYAAFGVDGGKSSGMVIKTRSGDRLFASIDPVPVVIAVYPR